VTVAFPVCLHYFLNQLRISLGPIYRHLGSTPNHLKKLQPRFHELHYLDHPGRRDPMVASVGSSVRGFLLFGILDEGVRPGNIVRAATRLGTKCQRGSRSPGAGSGYGDGFAVGKGWLDNGPNDPLGNVREKKVEKISRLLCSGSVRGEGEASQMKNTNFRSSQSTNSSLIPHRRKSLFTFRFSEKTHLNNAICIENVLFMQKFLIYVN
jgi:hypothetical protein